MFFSLDCSTIKNKKSKKTKKVDYERFKITGRSGKPFFIKDYESRKEAIEGAHQHKKTYNPEKFPHNEDFMKKGLIGGKHSSPPAEEDQEVSGASFHNSSFSQGDESFGTTFYSGRCICMTGAPRLPQRV